MKANTRSGYNCWVIKRSNDLIRVRHPRRDVAMYVSRALPPAMYRLQQTSYRTLDLPAAPQHDPRADFMQLSALLPLRGQPPELLDPAGAVGLTLPWRGHPHLDLTLPSSAVEKLRARERWPGIGVPVTPVSIGLTFSPSSMATAALRAFGLVRDRDALVAWLADLALNVELHESDRGFAVSLVDKMGLAQQYANKLIAELGGNRVLFSSACVRWLLMEALAAPPPPFGIPKQDPGSVMLERTWFPSISRAMEPTERELLRAVFLAHEEFLQVDGNVDDAQAILTAMASSGFGRTTFGDPIDRLVRAHATWRVPDAATDVKRFKEPPSELRRRLAGRFGLQLDDLFVHGVLRCLRVAGRIGGSEPASVVDQMLRLPRAAQSEAAFLALTEQYLVRDVRSLGDALRPVGGVMGWGSAPRAVTPAMGETPIVLTSRGPLVWSLEWLSVAFAELPRRLIAELGYQPSEIGKILGDLFEAYFRGRVRSLDRNSHWTAADSQIKKLFPAKRPDFVIAHGSDGVAIELTNRKLRFDAAAGDVQKVVKILSDYQEKLEQAAEVAVHRQRAGQLFSLPKLRTCRALLVVSDPVAVTPRIAAFAGNAPDLYVCDADEFELLLDMGDAGWSIPDRVAIWQQQDNTMLLGHSLERVRWIRSGPPKRAERLVQMLVDHFGSSLEGAA